MRDAARARLSRLGVCVFASADVLAGATSLPGPPLSFAVAHPSLIFLFATSDVAHPFGRPQSARLNVVVALAVVVALLLDRIVP